LLHEPRWHFLRRRRAFRVCFHAHFSKMRPFSVRSLLFWIPPTLRMPAALKYQTTKSVHLHRGFRAALVYPRGLIHPGGTTGCKNKKPTLASRLSIQTFPSHHLSFFGYGGGGGSFAGFVFISSSTTSIALFNCSSIPANSFAGSLSTKISGSTPYPSIIHSFPSMS
jgi:hypothetical protein